MRIIFMGTPEFAVPALEALIASNHEIIGVYSQPPRPAGRGMKLTPSPVQLLAEKHRIPVFTPASLKSPEEQEKFRALKADIAVVVAYGLLLPKAILEAPKLGCINIHPSALPRWRGAAPIQRTIMAGDTTTDICIMQMDEGLDTGDVLLRKTFAILPHTNAGALHDHLSKEAPALLLQALQQLTDGSVNLEKQSAAGVTYANKITKDEAKLDLTKPRMEILQHILGLSPFPGAYYIEDNERIKILDATLDGGPIAIQCADGFIHPTILQRAGGKRLRVQEFIAGFKP